MNWKSIIETREELLGIHTPDPHFTGGFAIGIIAVDLIYPKLPGNVANATTYPFPVLYKEVSFEIEELFAGSENIRDQIVNAAKYLEKQGVRAIIGACGYFAHFQQAVKEAVDIPVFMSSLCQLPLIKTGLSEKKKILVLAASGENINDELLGKVGTDTSRIIVQDIGHLESFAPIRYGSVRLDNGRLTKELTELAESLVQKDPLIGAILLECSDLPPYAKALQSVTGLAVYDFNTMIDMVYHSVVQRTYTGYM
ncbi:MAG: aspartate/glutamate racemase family protein [Lachnospiraceae bacterium]|nr:aspartate/glutamate racemase family protein [Lachnospiraceae bacterium]